MSRTFRIVKLKDYSVYRIEIWTEYWFRKSGWKVYRHLIPTYGYDSYFWIEKEFSSLQAARQEIQDVIERDCKTDYRRRKLWSRVWPE